MLKGVNDSPAEARALVRLLAGIPAKINLIPFNPWPGSPYVCSDRAAIETFAEIVNRAGYASPIRTPRGRDILAACGQLKSESEKLRASARRAGRRRTDRLMPAAAASPELQAWATGFPVDPAACRRDARHSRCVGAALYALITPHREIALIREGNAAAAVSFGGVLVGLALPLAASPRRVGVAAGDRPVGRDRRVFVQLAVFRLIDLVLHGLPRASPEGEMAAAALLVGAKIATAVMLAAAVAA